MPTVTSRPARSTTAARCEGFAVGQPDFVVEAASGRLIRMPLGSIGEYIRALVRQSEPLARFLSRGYRGASVVSIADLLSDTQDAADFLDYVANDPTFALDQFARQVRSNVKE